MPRLSDLKIQTRVALLVGLGGVGIAGIVGAYAVGQHNTEAATIRSEAFGVVDASAKLIQANMMERRILSAQFLQTRDMRAVEAYGPTADQVGQLERRA